MTEPEKSEKASAVSQAIRAKHERKTLLAEDIAALEASLLADIEAFDLEAAERSVRREESVNSGAGMIDAALVFPEIVPVSAPRKPTSSQSKENAAQPELLLDGSNLLSQLRQQAELRRQELHTAHVDRTSVNDQIDQALKHLFFFMHDFVQQLNIVKPAIPRDFVLLEKYAINQLVWQEGFADYRTQSQSAGALVELVTFTCRLSGNRVPMIEKEGPAIERFRHILFDYGLPFTCKEFKNERSYVERAEFEVGGEVSVSARWRADFTKGVLILETRNLERLGSALFTIHPQFVDYALLDDFGRLLLGQANRFRELARRE
ncbi:MAG TPA: hypothetical protein VLA64_02535 [Azonexus sp.]|nr:hypothetical protein [Azonexus sp.]